MACIYQILETEFLERNSVFLFSLISAGDRLADGTLVAQAFLRGSPVRNACATNCVSGLGEIAGG
jgi:hypothetical protein